MFPNVFIFRAEFGPLKSVGGASNMTMLHASFQCRQSSFLSTNSFVETRQYDNERAFLSDVKAWSKSTKQLKQEKHIRFMETEILTKKDVEKLKKRENLIGYGTSHSYNIPPPYSKVQSNLESNLSDANMDSSCISPPTHMLSDGFRKQEPLTFERSENVATIDRMTSTDRAPLLETIKVSRGECNGYINSYSGGQTMNKPANNDFHNQVVPKQSNEKYTFSQSGKGSITRHAPDVSPNGRKKNISLGKVNSVQTLKFTEAANGIKSGVPVEEFSKMTIAESGTKMREALATDQKPDIKERLNGVYDSVLVVDSVSAAKEVVSMLTVKYRNLVHACDTEVLKSYFISLVTYLGSLEIGLRTNITNLTV